jgi:endo-1,3-1,4-beta-glycanase ExoK
MLAIAGGMLSGSVPVLAQEAHGGPELIEPPPLDALPAPDFAPSKRARLADAGLTATNAPVWPNQIGPAAFVDRFETDELDLSWYRQDREPNATWAENDWRRENVVLGAPGLALVMRQAAGQSKTPVSSGEISRRDPFRYGYFESRFKVPRGAGVVSGFFTFAQEDGTNRTWNEIDVEILGRDTHTVELTVHVEGRTVHKKVALDFDAAEGFHTYAFEWAPDAVRWYIDNELAHEVTGAVARKIARPQRMHINVLGTDELHAWAGRLDPEAGPWTLEVSCMAYRPAYGGKSLCAE